MAVAWWDHWTDVRLFRPGGLCFADGGPVLATEDVALFGTDTGPVPFAVGLCRGRNSRLKLHHLVILTLTRVLR
jgi:hypothetical protein